MKRDIAILSDLWGFNRSSWFSHFTDILSPNCHLTFFDSCALGDIDVTDNNEETIHKQFIDFGIDKAANQLLAMIDRPKVYIGCSIGGLIVWKAGLLSLPIEKLVTISSTRLRYETQKPSCPISSYFGEYDEYKPDSMWFDSMECKHEIIKGEYHEMYKDNLVVSRILNEVLL